MAKNPVKISTATITDEDSTKQLTDEELRVYSQIEKVMFPEGRLPTGEWRAAPRNSLVCSFLDPDLNTDLLTLIHIAESQARSRFETFDELIDCTFTTDGQWDDADFVWTEDQKVAWLYVHVTGTLDRLGHAEPSEQLGTLANVSALLSIWLAVGVDRAMTAVRNAMSDAGRKGGIATVSRNPVTAAKVAVRKHWETWRTRPNMYTGKADFARDMMKVFSCLKSNEVICRWCRKWEDEVEKGDHQETHSRA